MEDGQWRGKEGRRSGKVKGKRARRSDGNCRIVRGKQKGTERDSREGTVKMMGLFGGGRDQWKRQHRRENRVRQRKGREARKEV